MGQQSKYLLDPADVLSNCVAGQTNFRALLIKTTVFLSSLGRCWLKKTSMCLKSLSSTHRNVLGEQGAGCLKGIKPNCSPLPNETSGE